MTSQARKFCEEMSQPEAVASLELSEAIAARYEFTATSIDGATHLVFKDSSYIKFTDKEGVVQLPKQF